MAKEIVPSEEQEHGILVDYLRMKGYTFHHSPNSTGSSPEAKRRANRMKRMGTSPGFPDIVLFTCGKRIAIELKSKRKGAKATQEQIDWLMTLSDYGFDCAVCHGADESIEFVEKVLKEET